jgi:hypothetical protein
MMSMAFEAARSWSIDAHPANVPPMVVRLELLEKILIPRAVPIGATATITRRATSPGCSAEPALIFNAAGKVRGTADAASFT